LLEVSKILEDDLLILLSLPPELLSPETLVNGHVLKKQFPGIAPMTWNGLRYPVPSQVSKIVHIDKLVLTVVYFIDPLAPFPDLV